MRHVAFNDLQQFGLFVLFVGLLEDGTEFVILEVSLECHLEDFVDFVLLRPLLGQILVISSRVLAALCQLIFDRLLQLGEQLFVVSRTSEALEGFVVTDASGASEFVERANLIVRKVFLVEGLQHLLAGTHDVRNQEARVTVLLEELKDILDFVLEPSPDGVVK